MLWSFGSKGCGFGPSGSKSKSTVPPECSPRPSMGDEFCPGGGVITWKETRLQAHIVLSTEQTKHCVSVHSAALTAVEATLEFKLGVPPFIFCLCILINCKAETDWIFFSGTVLPVEIAFWSATATEKVLSWYYKPTEPNKDVCNILKPLQS